MKDAVCFSLNSTHVDRDCPYYSVLFILKVTVSFPKKKQYLLTELWNVRVWFCAWIVIYSYNPDVMLRSEENVIRLIKAVDIDTL